MYHFILSDNIGEGSRSRSKDWYTHSMYRWLRTQRKKLRPWAATHLVSFGCFEYRMILREDFGNKPRIRHAVVAIQTHHHRNRDENLGEATSRPANDTPSALEPIPQSLLFSIFLFCSMFRLQQALYASLNLTYFLGTRTQIWIFVSLCVWSYLKCGNISSQTSIILFVHYWVILDTSNF